MSQFNLCFDECMIVPSDDDYNEDEKEKICDPDSIGLAEAIPECVDCLKRRYGNVDVFASQFAELVEMCGSTWTKAQNEEVFSLASEFGYSVVFAGPTSSNDDLSGDGASSAIATTTTTATTTSSTSDPASAAGSMSLVTVYATPPAPSPSPDPTSTSTSDETTAVRTSTDRAWIAGTVVGAVSGAGLLLLIRWLFLRRKRRRQQQRQQGEHGGLHGKPELHGDGKKQLVASELEAEERQKQRRFGPVELPGHQHDGVSELPTTGRNKYEGQIVGAAGAVRDEINNNRGDGYRGWLAGK